MRAITPLRNIVCRSRHGTKPSVGRCISLGAGHEIIDRSLIEIAIDIAPAPGPGEGDAAAAIAVGEALDLDDAKACDPS